MVAFDFTARYVACPAKAGGVVGFVVTPEAGRSTVWTELRAPILNPNSKRSTTTGILSQVNACV
jgi:hypothetical protein